MKERFCNIIEGDGKSVIMLYGEIGEGCSVDSSRIVSELIATESRGGKVELRINSQGGDVFSGMAIYNALCQSKSDIVIYVDGVAASMAAIIALCGRPLYMSPYAKLMLHNVSGGTYGSAKELRLIADQMEALQTSLAAMIAGRLSMAADDVADRYFSGDDHWITATEAVGMGLADGIYDMEAVDNPPTTTDGIYNFFNNRLDLKPQNTSDMALIDDIKAIPSFEDKADSSAVLAHIRELNSKALKADTLEKAVNSYKDEIDKLRKEEDDRIISDAVKTGKISKEQEDIFRNFLRSDRPNTLKFIDSMKQRGTQRAINFVNQEGASAFHGKTWDDIDKDNRLAELKSQDPNLFRDLYKQKYGYDYIE